MNIKFIFYKTAEDFLGQKPHDIVECVGIPPTQNSVLYQTRDYAGFASIKRIDYVIALGLYSATIHCIIN